MDKIEKVDAQKKLANIFFEMGMDEDVVSAITGLSKEETENIHKSKSDKKNNNVVDLEK